MAHRSDGPALSLGCLGMGTEQCAVVVVNSKCWKGGLASSAWHIDQMGPPYRSDVWAWTQSNAQWWMSIRSAGRACSCGSLVNTSLQIRQTSQAQRAPESAGKCKWSKHGECRRGNSVGQPIRDDVVDGRHQCRCYLRSLEYCWFAQPASRLASNTQQDAAVSARTLLG